MTKLYLIMQNRQHTKSIQHAKIRIFSVENKKKKKKKRDKMSDLKEKNNIDQGKN